MKIPPGQLRSLSLPRHAPFSNIEMLMERQSSLTSLSCNLSDRIQHSGMKSYLPLLQSFSCTSKISGWNPVLGGYLDVIPLEPPGVSVILENGVGRMVPVLGGHFLMQSFRPPGVPFLLDHASTLTELDLSGCTIHLIGVQDYFTHLRRTTLHFLPLLHRLRKLSLAYMEMEGAGHAGDEDEYFDYVFGPPIDGLHPLSQLTWLDVSYMQVSRLDLSLFPSLTILNIGNCKKLQLDTSMAKPLPKLQTLYISRPSLKYVLGAFGGSLQRLVIDDCLFNDSLGGIRELINLTHLRLEWLTIRTWHQDEMIGMSHRDVELLCNDCIDEAAVGGVRPSSIRRIRFGRKCRKPASLDGLENLNNASVRTSCR